MRLEVLCRYSGKIGYSYYRTAAKKMKELIEFRNYSHERGSFLNVYKCPYCRRFHYGNTTIEKKPNLRKPPEQNES